MAGGAVAGAIVAWAPNASVSSSAFSAEHFRPAGRSGVPAAPSPAQPAEVSATWQPYRGPGSTGPSRVLARGVALADPAAGTLLWSRSLNTERPIGSVTKVMTALVVIRAGHLNRKIRVPKAVIPYVNKYSGDSAGLHPGDLLTARQLLEAMLLPSGCDAAYTLAVAYGPGMPAFLAKMNATARQLGMLHTRFTSPDGLPYPTETSTYSTPADLLTLGLNAMKSPVVREIVGQRLYQIPKGPGHHHYWWGNTNDLIGGYQGAQGIKTGYTDAALHCLLFQAARRGRTLLGVVLGSPATGPESGAVNAARVLNWGFGLKDDRA
ncbi:MAG TPA: serine hydrolase [Streptosporangiaceae bacterium]